MSDVSSQVSNFEWRFETTQLGTAILKSGLTPEEGLLVYLDLKRANQGMILANELHQLYLLTPVSLSFPVEWSLFHRVYKRLNKVELNICEMIGVTERHIANYDQEAAMNGLGRSNTAGTFQRTVVKFKIPSRRNESPSKTAENISPGATKLYSEVDGFKAFAEMN